MGKIKIHVTPKVDYEWLTTVPERIQLEIENKIPNIRRATKKVVQSQLTENYGVEKGIYKRSFTIYNFAESKWQIGFQVFAKKPHYRLTHLLEGTNKGGHRIKIFTRGRGEMTRWGNIGMSFVRTKKRPSGYTRRVIHIKPAQDYADEKVPTLYRTVVTKKLMERMYKK